MTILPNAVYRFNAILIKLPMTFFTELEQKNFTMHMETQKTPNSQSSLEKEEWSWRNQSSWLQIILQSYSHQDSMVRAQKMATHSSSLAWKIPWMEEPGRLQSMGSQRVGHDWATSLHFTSDLWNKIENPEINSCTYGYLIFDKGGKNIQWGKDSLFNKWCWENWIAACKRMKLEHFQTPCTKINSKRVKDLHVRPETVKLLEENVGRILDDENQSKILYDPPPRVTEIKTQVNKWDLIKLKSFCTAKETISKVKRQP